MASSDATSVTTITDLCDDCLREVLLWVPIPNRIHLRSVCKRWCEVIDDSWSAVKKVLCDKPTEERHGMWGYDDTIDIATSSPKIYEGIMKRCGGFLTYLSEQHKEGDITVLPYAARHCLNIMELYIMVSSKTDDRHINQLMAVNQKLRVLYLDIKFKNAKICLRTIATDVLKELVIFSSKQNIFPPSILMSQKQIVRKANSLRRLSSYFVDEELIDLIGQKVELERLAITYCGNCLKEETFHPILNLKNLRELVIYTSFVMVARGVRQQLLLPLTDNSLVALANTLRLLEFLVLDVSHITDSGFVHLASLPKLSKLKVTCCPGVTDKFLSHFSRLETLSLVGCNIGDEGVIELLEKTQTMQELNVSVTFITNKTLITAIKETTNRDNGVRLKLHAGTTDATPWTFTGVYPLLEIIVD